MLSAVLEQVRRESRRTSPQYKVREFYEKVIRQHPLALRANLVISVRIFAFEVNNNLLDVIRLLSD